MKHYRWYVLGLLTASYACQSMDRQVLSIIVEPIKREFHVSDLAMGMLGGLAYTTSFALACLPVGWLIDRVRRQRLLAVLLVLWSATTFICGFARSYIALLVMRMGVGFTEAGAQPTSISLISDFFGPKERSTAIGYFYLSSAAGIAAIFWVGGLIAAHFGWRAAFWIAGLPGLLIAVVILLTLREPRRGQSENAGHQPAVPLAAVARHALATPALLHLAAGVTLTSLTVTATWLWSASLLVRLHGMGLAHAGPLLAMAALASAAGSALTGRLADIWSRTFPGALLIVPMITILLCVPCGVGLAYAPSDMLAIAMLFATTFMMGGYLGPSFSIAMALVAPGMRGVVAASLQMAINLFGSGLGPVLLGALSDSFHGPASLRPAFAITLCVNLWSGLHYYLAYRAMSAARPAAQIGAVPAIDSYS
jgi:MFS family permease